MSQPSNHQIGKCPVCESENIDRRIEKFDAICDDCGFVIHPNRKDIDLSWQEPKEGGNDSSTIDWPTECRVRNATEQQLVEAFDTLEDIADRLKLSVDLRKETTDIYCDAFRSGITDGRDTECLMAACVRLASLERQEPVPIGKLTEAEDIDEKKLRLSRLALQDELEVEHSTPTPKEYIGFLETILTLSESQVRESEDVLREVVGESTFTGKDPAGIAAGAVYLTGEDHTQQEVSEAVGLTTETVRQRIKQLQSLTEHE